MTMRVIAGAACVLLLQSGCSTGGAADDAPQGERALQQERWAAAAPADYTYEFQQQCFCVREQVQPVTIEVRDGAVMRAVSRETGEDLAGVEGLRWPTIADLFRVIVEAEANGVTPLVVRYDPELGYPTHIEAGSLAADAGVVYTASDLEPLQR
jgi:hypothetical protein